MMNDRIPVETREPIATFGVLRVLIALGALAGVVIFQVPHTAATLSRPFSSRNCFSSPPWKPSQRSSLFSFLTTRWIIRSGW